MSRADLSDAEGRFESGARMIRTSLDGADLSGVDLTNARITEEQLREAESLEGATMPDGRKYEDWLKDKEGRMKTDGNFLSLFPALERALDLNGKGPLTLLTHYQKRGRIPERHPARTGGSLPHRCGASRRGSRFQGTYREHR